MARILRGEVRWADLSPARGHEQTGARPVLVLSHDVFNDRLGTAIVAPITSQSQKMGFPLTLLLTSGSLPKQSWVKIGQIRVMSTERLGAPVGIVSPEDLVRVIEGLNEIIS